MPVAKMEIERRWVVKPSDLPVGLKKARKERIEQYYTMASGKAEERMRKVGKRYVRTTKYGSGLERKEIETRTTAGIFKKRMPYRIGSVIKKTRYRLRHAGLEVELDIFEGRLHGLVIAEVEFDSKKAAGRFLPLPWFSREVTRDVRYTNRNLAVKGLGGLGKPS